MKIVQVAARTLPGKEFSLGKHVIDYEVREREREGVVVTLIN